MGRTTRPPNLGTKTVVQTVKNVVSRTAALEVGGSEGSSKQKTCWTFELQKITPVGQGIAKGTAVRGVPDGSLIMVVSVEKGSLGFAPAVTSVQMLAAGSASLQGEVKKNQNNTKITVELCLT